MASEKLKEFDNLFSNDEISILKLLVYYVEPSAKTKLIPIILLLQWKMLLSNDFNRKCTSLNATPKEVSYFFEEAQDFCKEPETPLKRCIRGLKQFDDISAMLEFLQFMQVQNSESAESQPFSSMPFGMENIQDFINIFQIFSSVNADTEDAK